MTKPATGSSPGSEVDDELARPLIAPLIAVLLVVVLSGLVLWSMYSSISKQRAEVYDEALEHMTDVQTRAELDAEQSADALEGLGKALVTSLSTSLDWENLAQLVQDADVAESIDGLEAVTVRAPEGFLGVNADGTPLPGASSLSGKLYSISTLSRLESSSEPFTTFSVDTPVIAGVHFPIGGQRWLSFAIDANDLVSSSDPNVDVSVARTDAPAGTFSTLDAETGRIDTPIDFVNTPVLLTAVATTGVELGPSLFMVYVGAVVAAALAFGTFVGASAVARTMRSKRIASERSLRLQAKLDAQEWAGFEQTIVGMAELDETGAIREVNRAFSDQTGYDKQHLVGRLLVSLTHEDDRHKHQGDLHALITGEVSQHEAEHRFLRPDGSEIWVSEHVTRSVHAGGVRLLVQIQDVTFRRQATWELARQALHDELTDLPNRAMLLHRLRAALDASGSSGGMVGVMFIDVDRFKVVNDSLGHEVGDQLLMHIARQLGTAVREDDTVSRFGGDEFVVLCGELMGVGEAVAVADRIRRSLSEPYQCGSNKLYTTLSIGLAISTDGAHTADELLRDADAAMYRAKELGRNRVEIFDDSMREKLVERMELEQELRAALRDESLSLYYQSIVDCPTGYPVGFESLVRWVHPTRGLLTPGQFLPTAEEAGLTSRIDVIGLRKACLQLATWTRQYPAASELYVSSNIVPTQFPRFIDQIDETLRSTGLAPHQLLVEVVENALLDDAEGSLNAIMALREMGVQVAIDDFGTGYSSLSYLTQFRPDKLKIDRSFVMKLPEDRATGAVVRAIADMARALDIAVIAEGVETIEQADALRQMGVPYVQGFLFAKPRPPEEIESWLGASHGLHESSSLL